MDLSKKKRIEEAQNRVLNECGVDYIMDYRVAPDFVECICSMGGDTLVFRVYNNGTITER